MNKYGQSALPINVGKILKVAEQVLTPTPVIPRIQQAIDDTPVNEERPCSNTFEFDINAHNAYMQDLRRRADANTLHALQIKAQQAAKFEAFKKELDAERATRAAIIATQFAKPIRRVARRIQ